MKSTKEDSKGGAGAGAALVLFVSLLSLLQRVDFIWV